MRNRVLLNLIAFSWTANVIAQDIAIGARAQDPRLALKEQAFEREMTVLIDDMQRVCDLSDEQVRKLKLAAKGAVKMAMASYRKKMLPVLEADEDEPNEVADEQEEVEIAIDVAEVDLGFDAIAINDLVLGGLRGAQSISPVKQPLWKATVRKALTKEQSEKYAVKVNARNAFARRASVYQPSETTSLEGHGQKSADKGQSEKYAVKVNARNAFARRASVAKFVARVDARLLLSVEQRDKFIQIVDAEVGDLLTKDDPVGNVVFMPAGETPPAIAEDQLKTLFSEAQFSEWKRSFAAQLSTRKMMQGIPLPGQAGGAIEIQINGAPILQP